MGFTTDKQTLDDLNITGKFRPQSIFSLFNDTHTKGGEKLLDKMFQQPLSHHTDINARSAVFKYFHERNLSFPFNRSVFETAEAYLGAETGSSFPVVAAGLLQKKIIQLAVKDEQYEAVRSGVLAAIEILSALRDFLKHLD